MEMTLEEALQRGVDAHQAGKIEEADSYYTAILKTQPNHPDTNYYMGMLGVSLGKSEQALPYLKRALETAPTIIKFWTSYIDALTILGRLQDALSVLGDASRRGLRGENFDQLRVKILQLQNDGPPVNDHEVLPQPALQRLIELYKVGRLNDVISQSENLVNRFTNSAILFNLIGAAYSGLEQFDQAVIYYQRALKIQPDLADVHNNMGVAYKNLNDFNSAVNSYLKAVELRPDYAEAHTNLGMVLSDLGNYNDALASFDKALGIDTEMVKAISGKSSVLLSLGQSFDGLKLSERAEGVISFERDGSVSISSGHRCANG